MKIKVDLVQALVIDVQKKLIVAMPENEKLIQKTVQLLKGLQLFQIPVTITTQYKKGLGETISDIKQFALDREEYDKLSFGVFGNEEIRMALDKKQRTQVIVCGIEAHICVLQTVLDLLEAGYQPIVVMDCIASRNKEDKDVASMRMQQSGAIVTTVESLLYELMVTADSEVFSAVLELVKHQN